MPTPTATPAAADPSPTLAELVAAMTPAERRVWGAGLVDGIVETVREMAREREGVQRTGDENSAAAVEAATPA